MNARLLAPLLAMMLALVPTAGAAQCRLCAPGDREAVVAPSRPLDITIETALDFSRVGGTRGGGSIAIDERSGRRAVAGLVDLGGFALKGTARVTGEPFRRIRVAMPASILLTSPEGGSAEAVELRTTLPPDPQLDAQGALSFAFAGRLIVGGDVAGALRGRFAITVDYD